MKSRFISRVQRLALCAIFAVLLAGCGGDKPDALLASARDYLAKNDPKAAVIQLKNALQANPDLPEGRYLLGLALLRGGDPVGSETELRKALALKHPAEKVAPPLAQAMLAQGQYKKLTDEFAQTKLGQAAAEADLKTSIAAAQGAQGNAGLAKDALAAALAADPTYLPAQLAQARNKATAQDFDGALAAAEAIIASAPNNHEALKLKGDILLYGKNKSADALAAYRKAVEVKPDYTGGHVAILTMLLRDGRLDDAVSQLALLKKVSPNGLQTRYFETMVAYQQKNFKLARESSQQLMKLAPNSPMSLQLAGAVELQLNSLVQAESYLTKAVQAAPATLLARRLLVTTYLRSGQPAKALTALQPALKGDNIDAATNSIAGEVYLQNGDTKKAEEFFAQAAKQDPKNTRARTALALTHLAGGRDEAAFAELQEISGSETGVTADLALISAHLRRGDFDKALKAIDVLEGKQPGKPLAANLRGRTLLAKKDIPGSRKSFERSVELDPTYFPSVASLAALDIVDKKPEDARKRFEAVLAKDPKNAQALLAVAELRARSGGAKDEVAELIQRAVTANPTDKGPRLLLVDFHLRNKDFKQALSVAQSAVAAVPDSPELLDALGRAQQASGEMNQALASFNQVATMQPQSPIPQMRLAEAHMAAKNKDAAASSLRKALDLKPDLLDAQRGLILLAIDAKNFQDATTIARNIQKQRPKEETGYEFEGDIAASQKKWDVAADAYRNGLKQVQSPKLAIKLHTALGVAGKAADAEKFSTAWLKDNPKDVSVRRYLGDVAVARKEYAPAEKMYVDVIRIQPNDVLALNNLAWVTGKLGKDGAIAYAEKAVSLAPAQPAFMDTLAMLLSEKGDYAKALEWQTKAVAAQPENGAYKLNLAKVHLKGGNKDLARKELDALAKLGDKFQGQSEVTSLLKNL